MLNVISRVPSYYFFRLTGWPRKLPLSLTLSISYKCNSRCKTCNIHERQVEDLSLDEWRKVFSSLGKSLFWVTISGGEPFLHRDLVNLVCALYDQCRPSIINIPTNGLLVDQITEATKAITLHCTNAQIVINISIDEIEEKHDSLRGIPGSYEKALKTFRSLRDLALPNIAVGIHTVISRFNVERMPEVYQVLRRLDPDSYITEIAEEREELCTMGSDITPGYKAYALAVDYLTKQLKGDPFAGIGKITSAFRVEYYAMVKKILKDRHQVIPCYAGFVSAQIAPDGEVWMCCTKAESMGNVRDVRYNFQKVWFSEKAEQLRNKLKDGKCFCPLANTAYTNMLLNPGALWRVGMHYLKSKISNSKP